VKARVVTGFGVASALGVGREAFLSALREGERATAGNRVVETFDAATYPGARVAEVRGFDASRYLGDKGLRTLDRLAKLLVVTARLALHDAGLKKDGAWISAQAHDPDGSSPRPWPERAGIVVSNAYGSLEAITELDRVAVLEDARYINPSRFPLTVSNSAAGYVSIWEDLRAVNVSVSDGNCGALNAVACADVLLEQGRADVLLVGGAEAMSEALFLAFHRLGAAGLRTASTAIDAPEGPCIGEAAGLLAIERAETARARSAQSLAEIVGYGTSFAPPDREASLVYAAPLAIEQAMADALSDAGVAPNEIDVVVSGVSGLRVFDDAELAAIGRVLGKDACVVAPKLALGETLGAAGAMGMLAAIAHLDPNGASTPVVQGRLGREVRTALVTSLGYYGNASALVMKRARS
jgi:3-oxoacyl-[acyl-carrier-protein] synthase II